MGRHRMSRCIPLTLLVITTLGTLVLLGGLGEAGSFRAEVSQYDFLCYEVDVDTLHQRLVYKCNVNLEIRVYGPDGKEIDVNGTSGFKMDFVPARKGKHTILLVSDYYPEMVQGECNFDMKETSTAFKTTITDGQWLDYEISVEDNNKPIVVHIESEGTYDRIYPSLVDPSGDEVNPWMDGSVNRSIYIYPARSEGTYVLSIEGSRILLPEGTKFKASCNYPISGPGIPVTILGMSPTTLLILVILVVLVVVSLVAVRWQMRKRKRERASYWRPVTDISGFEQPSRAAVPAQTDFSYISKHARRRSQRRAPPAPPPRHENVARYAPDTVIVQPASQQLQAAPPAQGMDGYTLPPPPPRYASKPSPTPPPEQVPQVQQVYQPPAVQPAPTPEASRPVQQAPPPQPVPAPSASQPVEPPPPPAQQAQPTPAPQPPRPTQPPPLAQQARPAPAPHARPAAEMKWPRCSRCGNILMANHPVCSRCGAPR